jgi:hypothetical protein
MKSDQSASPQSDNCSGQIVGAESPKRLLSDNAALLPLPAMPSGFSTCLGMLVGLSKALAPRACEVHAAQPESKCVADGQAAGTPSVR